MQSPQLSRILAVWEQFRCGQVDAAHLADALHGNVQAMEGLGYAEVRTLETLADKLLLATELETDGFASDLPALLGQLEQWLALKTDTTPMHMTSTEVFNQHKQRTLQALRDAVSDHPGVQCAPLNGFGMLGWAFEAGTTNAEAMQGNLLYGLAYLEHMINQGFETAFAVLAQSQPTMVCLKTWEPGESEPPWPTLQWQMIYLHGQEQFHGL